MPLHILSLLALLITHAYADTAGPTSQLSIAEDNGDSWNRSAVLGIPAVVGAGEETLWHLNVSNTVEAQYEHRKMQIYLRSWSRPETEDDPTSDWPDLYCYISSCVWTNLTTIPITIPRSAFGSSARISTSFSLYDSASVKFSTWGDDATVFNLTGGSATLSDWEKTNGWGAVGHWSTRLSCDDVPCARSCIEKYLDVKEGYYYQQSERSAFKSCVDGCNPLAMGTKGGASSCITANVTEAEVKAANSKTAASETGASETTASGSGAAAEATEGGDADDSAPDPGIGVEMLAMALLGWFALWAL